MRTYCYKIIFVFSLICLPVFAFAETPVSVYINSDIVWNSSGSPYVIESTVTLGAGATLTIEQGTIVKFGPYGELDINGSLVTHSTLRNGVIFTSLTDDVGGDTNEDGASTTPNANSWSGITFQNGSTGNLSGVTVKYAGKSGRYAIHNKGVILNLENIDVNNNGNFGLYQQGRGTTTLSHSTFSNHNNGIFIAEGSIIAKNNIFIKNGIGLLTHIDPGIAKIENNLFTQNHYPLQLHLGKKTLIHSGNTFVDNDINAIYLAGETASDVTIDNHDGPYVGGFQVASGTTLTINPGTIFKFEKTTGISILGKLVARGAPQNKIYFTSLTDDTVGGDTNNDGDATTPNLADWPNIAVSSGSIDFDNVVVTYGGNSNRAWDSLRNGAAIRSYKSSVAIKNSDISSNNIALVSEEGTFTIASSTVEKNYLGIFALDGVTGTVTGSSFASTTNYAITNGFPNSSIVSAEHNWWGDLSGPYQGATNIDGKGVILSDGVSYNPWLTSSPFATSSLVTCCSNVAFLPGLGGSRLYKPGMLNEDQLWEPNGLNDLSQLKLSAFTGSSVLPDIYTKDLVDETYLRIDDWPGTNTYKTFGIYMDEELVDKNKINEWKPIVYDWRLGLPEVISRGEIVGVENGLDKISYTASTSSSYIIEELRRLADTSQTGKVTIVTHSNGGLVIKYLLKELADTQDSLLSKIDTVIFVAVPQLGTPEAIAALLHGTSKVGKGGARDLSEEMKSAYHLLPSKKYFDKVQTPVVEFTSDVSKISQLADLAGSSISNYSTLQDFMIGRSGKWNDPPTSDIDTPNVLDQSLLTYAEGVHSTLDNWQMPSTIRLIQIAGTGLDTVRGIKYDDCDVPFCPNTLKNLDRELLQTKRGDGTVVLPSAITDSNMDRIYVDINKSNSFFKKNRKHGSMLEIDLVQELLKDIVVGNPIQFSDVIKDSEPSISAADNSFSFTLHSPLTLTLYDSQNRHTGLIGTSTNGIRYYEENIPNSYYREFGEVKYAGSSAENLVTMKLVGESSGTFTLEVNKNNGDQIVETATYKGIPVVAGMVVTIPTLTATSSIATTALSVDVDADGIVDTIIDQGVGVSTEEWIGFLRGYVTKLSLPIKKKANILKILQRLEKIMEKEKGCEDRRRKEKCEYRLKVRTDMVSAKLENTLDRFYRRSLISLDEYKQIKDIIKK
jgi:hypothetical protein